MVTFEAMPDGLLMDRFSSWNFAAAGDGDRRFFLRSSETRGRGRATCSEGAAGRFRRVDRRMPRSSRLHKTITLQLRKI